MNQDTTPLQKPPRTRASALVCVLLALWCVQFAHSVGAQSPAPANSAPALTPMQAYEVQAAALEQTLSNQLQEIARAQQAKAAAESRANLVWLLAAVGLGVLAIHWLAPRVGDFLNRRYDPWAPVQRPEMALEEEEAFSRFAQDFSLSLATPSPAPRGGGPPPGCESPKGPQRPSAPSVEAAPDGSAGLSEDPIQRFLRIAPDTLSALRATLAALRAAEPAARQKLLAQFQAEVLAFKTQAHLPPLLPFWQIAGALEGLLAQLAARPAETTPSVLRSIASALDLLQTLASRGAQPGLLSHPAVRVLAVDDDPICRHALSFSLAKVLGPPDLASDGMAALALAEKVTYDLIFLDIEMPGMNGFELCTRLGATAPNQATPVVFVTRHSDFDSRAKSCLHGGRDLLGKPFLTFELALKALTLVTQRRLQTEATTSAPVREAEASSAQTELQLTAHPLP